MKTSCLLFLAFFSTLMIKAQTYSTSMSTGSREYLASFRQNPSTVVMPPPVDQVLSSWQPLPFAWKFYGSEVRGYRISDNGYITFDSGASLSSPVHATLPSKDAPNNAIFAYWDDLHTSAGAGQWSNEIRTCTWGSAPNRVHVIYWIAVVPKGVEWSSSNSLSFALALFEGGDFDVTFVAGRSTVRIGGAIGAENEAGTAAVTVSGSPEIPYPSVGPDPTDDVSYHFVWTNAATDLALVRHALPLTAKIQTAKDISGMLKNTGIDTIRSYDLAWSANGGPAQSTSVQGIAIEPNASAPFTHPVPWTPNGAAGLPGGAGAFSELRIWISNVNGGLDGNRVNDTLTARVFVNLGILSATRRPLVEEFTGAWCGWCPDGGLQMQDMESSVPEAVLVSIHAGGLDSMIATGGAAIAAAYRPAYPTAMVDRMLFPGEAGVPINRSNRAWVNRALQHRSDGSPVDLSIAVQEWNASSGVLRGELLASWLDYQYPGPLFPDNVRYSVYIVEDRVTGSGKGFNQTNYYSGNSSYPNHPYYSESNPIVGFVHRHVLRAVLTPDWGAIAASTGTPGATLHIPFETTIPVAWNPANLRLAAFASYFDDAITLRNVLNATEVPLGSVSSAADGPSRSFRVEGPFPNPTAAGATISIELSAPAHATLELFDGLGRRIALLLDTPMAEGRHSVGIPSGCAPGLYWLQVRAGLEQRTRLLLVR